MFESDAKRSRHYPLYCEQYDAVHDLFATKNSSIWSQFYTTDSNRSVVTATVHRCNHTHERTSQPVHPEIQTHRFDTARYNPKLKTVRKTLLTTSDDYNRPDLQKRQDRTSLLEPLEKDLSLASNRVLRETQT